MTAETPLRSHIGAAFDGCYNAARAAALSGVPKSTVYYWARKNIFVPTISPVSPKQWSYADLMAMRVIYWLRHQKQVDERDIAAASMLQVRKAIAELGKLGLDIWDSEYRGQSPLRVTDTRRVYVLTPERLEDLTNAGVFESTLDVLGAFHTEETAVGPDLLRPRPHLRIVPGKVSGEPHVERSRVTTLALSALSLRGYSEVQIAHLYPMLPPPSIEEAIDLEHELAA